MQRAQRLAQYYESVASEYSTANLALRQKLAEESARCPRTMEVDSCAINQKLEAEIVQYLIVDRESKREIEAIRYESVRLRLHWQREGEVARRAPTYEAEIRAPLTGVTQSSLLRWRNLWPGKLRVRKYK